MTADEAQYVLLVAGVMWGFLSWLVTYEYREDRHRKIRIFMWALSILMVLPGFINVYITAIAG